MKTPYVRLADKIDALAKSEENLYELFQEMGQILQNRRDMEGRKHSDGLFHIIINTTLDEEDITSFAFLVAQQLKKTEPRER